MQRLRLQAQVWEPAATEFLASLDIAPGWKALDLGCGAMGILRPLSRSVGDAGTVVGLDSDPVQLAAARSFVNDVALGNVSIMEGDAFHTGLPAAHFDLVHVRFLFAPVGRDAALLAEMLRLLRPGGIIAIQEPDASCWNVAPPDPSWTNLKSAIPAAFRAGGGDFDAGCRTFGMLRAAGVQQLAQRNAVLAVAGQHPYKRLPLQFAGSLRSRILDGGLLSELQLQTCLSDVTLLTEDPDSVMTTFVVTQVAGRKPG
ncbi:MAG: class I SAM-dependent methyltransferase [Pseudomonadota bacterium]|nr:class I SAM-dependent methyltransferase [Pseudomonadota bacterium]